MSQTKAQLLGPVLGTVEYAGDVNFDSGTLFVDSANNRVGVGTDNPLNTLHVKGPTGGVSAKFTDAINATVFISHPSAGKSKIADSGGNYGFEFDTASVNVLTGGTEKLRIDSSGNVGIGTNNPILFEGNVDNPNNGKTLSLYGSSPAINLVSSSGTGYSLINFGRSGSGSNPYRAVVGYDQSNDDLVIAAFSDIIFKTNGNISDNTEKLRITTTGNVGIGTTNPSYKLQVNESTNSTSVAHFTNSGGNPGSVRGIGYITFGISPNWSPGAYIGWDQAALSGYQTDLTFGTRDNSDVFPTERLRITKTGNVGIGTTDPNHKLRVEGSCNFRDKVYIHNNTQTYNSEANPGLYLVNATTGDTGGLILGADNNIDSAYIQPLVPGTSYDYRLSIAAMGGNVGIGNTDAGYKFDVSGTSRFRNSLIVGTVRNTTFRGYVAGNSTVSHDVTGLGSETTLYIVCGFNHFGLLSYGCTLVTFAAQSPGFTVDEVHRYDTGLGGSWTISKPANGTIRITKNAGSYVGSGYYFILVYSTS